MRYVCPENGRPMRCKTCGQTGPHIREELVAKGAPVPGCIAHGVSLVAAPLTSKETR